MDEEPNEEAVDKNQYHLEDDEFLNAPGGLLNDNSKSNESSKARSDEETKENTSIPSKKKISIKLERNASLTYGLTDDSSDSSDDEEINMHRKYTTQSYTQQTVDSKDELNPNQSTIGKQYMISLNDKSFLRDPNGHTFPSNYIKTSKYTIITFIPLNLFEQFRRIANIYFLMIIVIQLLPGVSPFPIETSIMPLAFILTVGAIKDGIEDYDRHKSDRIANSMAISYLKGSKFTKTISADLVVSDIILIKRNETVPADCIVLSVANGVNATDSRGVCYINTSSMDGENAPKLRRAVKSTHNITNGDDLHRLRGYVKCPINNKSLHGFTGALSIKKSTIPKQIETHNNKSNKRNSNKRLSVHTYGTIKEEEDDDDDDDVQALADDDNEYLAAKITSNNSASDHDKNHNSETELKKGDFICGLSDSNFIFRGSKVVNTQCVIGLVLFVGSETKLMLNRNEVPFKFSKFEKILNGMIASILIFNFILCIVFGIAANIVPEPFPELERTSWFHGFILDFCSWLILTSWMIPFSLYVTLELVKMVQAQWVAWDDAMSYECDGGSNEWDTEYGHLRYAKTKNSNLNEELGHIDYIFTDKTGTLTQNAMELSKCSVGGMKYITSIASAQSIADHSDFNAFSSLISNMIKYQHHKYEQYHIKNQSNQKDDNKNENQSDTHENDTHFVLNLLLCSSILPSSSSMELNTVNRLSLSTQKLVRSQSKEAKESVENTSKDAVHNNNKIEFQSPSPDEVAFAEALSSFGVVLLERQPDGTMIIGLNGRRRVKYRILATLDFTARRKRMTVIVLDEFGSIYLYCKGADSTLFRLCSPDTESKSLIHLTKRHVTSFARDGSRTMVIAYRALTSTEYDFFDRSYREAEVALGPNRQQLIENAFSHIEHSLRLLGCTAVEDQLQEGVTETIYKLREAQLKVIMLTGDKQETAVSIGRQSGIIPAHLSSDSQLLFLSARAPTNPKDLDSLEKQQRRVDKKLQNIIKRIETEKEDDKNQASALILNGDALEMCLHPLIIDNFLYLFEYCSTIVCNRCDPTQKAMLVGCAKHRLDGVALAIGDGANDVSMIQESNVGVGIMGKEGTQASLASDFVIHRFRHILRLLFVHGRYSFLRTSQVSLLSLYKNMAFMLTVCYYGYYSLYTAQSCFDPYLMSAFNLFFVALFPLIVGAFEQDIDQKTATNHPISYHYFKINSIFSMKHFAFWMFTAAWQSLVWFIVAVVVYYDNLDIWASSDGTNGGLFVWGTQIFTANVVIICFKMMMETYHWNWTYFVSTAGSIIIYIITLSILSNWLLLDSDMFYVMQYTFNSSTHWLVLIVQCVLCLFPGILYNLWSRERYASLSTVLYEAKKFGYLTKNGVHRPTRDVIQDYLKR